MNAEQEVHSLSKGDPAPERAPQRDGSLAFRISAMAVMACVCLLMAGPLFLHLDKTGPFTNGDWQQVYFHLGAARQAVVEDGCIDFWCPYVGGGFPLASHPHDPTFSPLFPVTLIFGELAALRINVALIYLAGALGMFLFTSRCTRYSPWGAFAATLIYSVAGWLPARLFGGNYWETFYYLFPLILFCIHKAAKDRRFLFFSACLLYLLLCEANYGYVVNILFLGIICSAGKFFGKAEGSESSRDLLKTLALAVIFSLAMGAVKVYLVSGLLAIDPRHVDYFFRRSPSPMSYSELFLTKQGLMELWIEFFQVNRVPESLVSPAHGLRPDMLPQYIGCGFIPLVLALFAVLRNPKRFLAPLLVLILALFWTIGHLMTVDFLRPLTFIPIFKAISAPLKTFNYFILFCICVMCGGFFNMMGGTKRILRTVLLSLILASAAVPPLAQHWKIFPNTFVDTAPKARKDNVFFQVDQAPLYSNLKDNFGIINWLSSLHVPAKARPRFHVNRSRGLWEPNTDYQGETWVQGSGKSTLLKVGFDGILLKAHLDDPGTVIVNFNYAPGWQTDAGKVVNADGLLGVAVQHPGSHDIRLSYHPPGIHVFMGFSLLFLIVFTRLCWRKSNNHSRIFLLYANFLKF